MGYFKKRHNTYRHWVSRGRADTDGGRADLETYQDFLNSAFWQKLRGEILQKHKRCYVCSTNKNLEVHHITYRRMFRPDRSQLVVLCRMCHQNTEDIKWKYRNDLKSFQMMRDNFKAKRPVHIGLAKRYFQTQLSKGTKWSQFFKKYPNGMFTRSN